MTDDDIARLVAALDAAARRRTTRLLAALVLGYLGARLLVRLAELVLS